MVFLVTQLLNNGVWIWLAKDILDFWKGPIYYPVTFPIQEIAYMGSGCMTVLLTVERYLNIVHTHLAEKWTTNKRTLAYIGLFSLIALLSNITSFLIFTWDTDGTVIPTEFSDTDFSRAFDGLVRRVIIRYVVALIVLITLSTIVVIKVYFIVKSTCKFVYSSKQEYNYNFR